MTTFTQICRVDSGEYDGDDSGHEWPVHYVLYATEDDGGAPCFDLYDDEGTRPGNGTMIARGYHKHRMISLILRLGRFIEWQFGVEPIRAAE